MLLKVMLVYSPVAVMSLLVTCTVISVDDGLLRISTGCASPLFSPTLYVGWLNLIVAATKNYNRTVNRLLSEINSHHKEMPYLLYIKFRHHNFHM